MYCKFGIFFCFSKTYFPAFQLPKLTSFAAFYLNLCTRSNSINSLWKLFTSFRISVLSWIINHWKPLIMEFITWHFVNERVYWKYMWQLLHTISPKIKANFMTHSPSIKGTKGQNEKRFDTKREYKIRELLGKLSW